MADELCRYCRARPPEECQEPVDHRFPSAAREAYTRAGYTYALKCHRGQTMDMAKTGWCMDRIVRHPDWTGADVPLGVSPPQGSVRRRTRAGYPERAR